MDEERFRAITWRYNDQVRFMSGAELLHLLTDLVISRSNLSNSDRLNEQWDALISIVEGEMARRKETK